MILKHLLCLSLILTGASCSKGIYIEPQGNFIPDPVAKQKDNPSTKADVSVVSPVPTREVKISLGSAMGSKTRIFAQPILDGDTVWALDAKGRLFSANLVTEEPWHIDLMAETMNTEKASPFAPAGGLALDSVHHRIIASTSTGDVFAFDTTTHDEVWHVFINAPLHGNMSVQNDHLWIVSDNDSVFVLDATTGQNVWTSQSQAVALRSSLGSAQPLLLSATEAIVGYSSGTIERVKVGASSPVWQQSIFYDDITSGLYLSKNFVAAPVLQSLPRGGSIILAGTVGSEVAGLNPTTGKKVWSQPLATQTALKSTPQVAWVVQFTPPLLVGLEPQTGTVFRATSIPSKAHDFFQPQRVDIDAQQEIWVLDQMCTLYRFDAKSQTLLNQAKLCSRTLFTNPIWWTSKEGKPTLLVEDTNSDLHIFQF